MDRYVDGLFPYWKLECPLVLFGAVPQQLHAEAELTPGRMNDPHHLSALPSRGPIYGWLPSPFLNLTPSPIVQVN